jgi:threonine dehydratase
MTIDFALIAEAARVLRPAIIETPLVSSPVLDAIVGARVLCKADNLQRTGSFKYRGAFFRLSKLTAAERARGVVAFSSGNFAQALAAAGAAAGIAVTIVMPVDAPRTKIDATRGYGAEVVISEHGTRNREEAANELAMRLADSRGLTKLHPFDDPFVVAGQASCGIEILRQAAERGETLDALVVPVGGSGLIAGVALAVRTLAPATRVIGAEPDGFDDLRRSLMTGDRERVTPGARSICDALQAAMPGAVPFGAAQGAIAEGVSVADADAIAGMRAAFSHLKLVCEPSGAIALGAVLAGRIGGAPRTIGVVLSGGNIAIEDYARLLVG